MTMKMVNRNFPDSTRHSGEHTSRHVRGHSGTDLLLHLLAVYLIEFDPSSE